MARKGKRMRDILADIDRERYYTVSEAIELLRSVKKTGFDESLEVAINLGVDPRHADQMVRGMAALPHGTGKSVRVAVFAKDDKAAEAEKAGAERVGAEDLAEELQTGEIAYERVLATPDMMGVVGKLGRVLGPRGLMPNPKLGTVTNDIAQAIEEAKAGQVQFRVEKTGIIHAGVGKLSFEADKLEENVRAFVDAIVKAKPSGAKGQYLKKMSVTSTMGPGLKVQLAGLT